MESVNSAEIGGNARKFLTSPRLEELKKEFEQNGGKWKEFKIGELFEVESSEKIFHANTLNEIFENQVENSYPYVVRSTQNNGIRGYIIEDVCFLNEGNSLSFAQDTFSVFYQQKKFFTGNKVKILRPKFILNHQNANFFVCSFNKVLSDFSWGVCSDVNFIKNLKLTLPATPAGTPDFSYMERYIGKLEQARVSELKQTCVSELAAYLRAAGLENYDLTAAEQTALDDFKNGKIRFKEFKIGELFDVVKGKRLTKQNIRPGNINFLGAISSNNGIRERIETTTVWKPNCISVNYNGSVGCSFYQEEPFYASDDVNICYSKENWSLNRKRALFFCAVFKNFSQKFSYTQKWNKERMIESFVFIPVTDNVPDFAFMESFITAQQKLAIKDVVLWKDKVISTTKTVINES